MSEADKDARIAELESVLRELCGAVAEAYLTSDPEDQPKAAAMLKVYREARRLGVWK